MFLKILLAFVFVLLGAVFVTQVLYPVITNKPLFPAFRKRKVKLEDEITELNAQIEEQYLEDQINDLKKQLKKDEENTVDNISK